MSAASEQSLGLKSDGVFTCCSPRDGLLQGPNWNPLLLASPNLQTELCTEFQARSGNNKAEMWNEQMPDSKPLGSMHCRVKSFCLSFAFI